jgi:hypothetical protein
MAIMLEALCSQWLNQVMQHPNKAEKLYVLLADNFADNVHLTST